jgi:hypothetical protein
MFANNKEKENFTSKADYSDHILLFPRLGSYESLCDFRGMERLRGKYERGRDWSLIVELVVVRNSVRLIVASSTSGSKRPRIAAPRSRYSTIPRSFTADPPYKVGTVRYVINSNVTLSFELCL